MKDTENAKKLIEQALMYMPGDFALSAARTYLSHALKEIAQVEEKRGKRAVRAKKNAEAYVASKEQYTPTIQVNPFMTDKQKIDIIGKLDQMIEAENGKIKKVKEAKALEVKDEFFLG